jgi:hypothetical protein
LGDAASVVVPEQANDRDETGVASLSRPAFRPDRELLVQKGEEMVARGNVSGARLFFQPAAEAGDVRAAIGLARSFDPKFFVRCGCMEFVQIRIRQRIGMRERRGWKVLYLLGKGPEAEPKTT